MTLGCNTVSGRHVPGSLAQRACPVHGVSPHRSTVSAVADGLAFAGAEVVGRRDEAIARQARNRAATSADTSPEVLAALASDPYLEVVHDALRNRNCPPDVLERLADAEDEKTRGLVALNESTPSAVVERLALNDDRVHVRRMAACNINVSPELLARLAREATTEVLKAVATNKRTPAESLAFLARSNNSEVRIGVAANKSAPAAVIELLLHDSEVAESALHHPSVTSEQILHKTESPNPRLRQALPALRAVTVEILEILARDRDDAVRLSVIKASATPNRIIAQLQDDEDAYVARIAFNAARRRIAKRFGVDPDNTEAIDMLHGLDDWWDIFRDDGRVTLIKAMHPDACDDLLRHTSTVVAADKKSCPTPMRGCAHDHHT